MSAELGTVPQSQASGPFDITFDSTFRGLLISTASPVETACREPGALLHWLSPTGWATWLFEGVIDTGKVVSSRGQYQQAGVRLHTQKESALLLTVRTANISADEAEAVATVFDSISVYLLAPDEEDLFHPIPVSIEPGTFNVHTTREMVHTIELSFTLPARRSQRR